MRRDWQSSVVAVFLAMTQLLSKELAKFAKCGERAALIGLCTLSHQFTFCHDSGGNMAVAAFVQWTAVNGTEPGRLPADLSAALLARARRVVIAAGQTVIGEGSRSDEVYFIVNGELTVSVLSFGGWETVFRNMGPGELVGEIAAIDGGTRSATVVARAESELAVLTAAQFRAFLAEVPRAGLWLAQQLAVRVRNLSDRAFEMASLPVAGRLIAELIRLPGTTDGDRRQAARMPTHAELAARIGTHRETVTRELRNLARRGVISQQGRALEIPSLTVLESLIQGLRR